MLFVKSSHRLEELEESTSENEHALKDLRKKYEQLKNEFEEVKRERDEFGKQNVELKQRIEELETSLNNLGTEKHQLKSRIVDLEQQTFQLSQSLKKSLEENERITNENSVLSGKVKTLQQNEANAANKIKSLEHRVATLSADSDAQRELTETLEKEMNGLRKEMKRLNTGKEEALKQLQDFGTEGLQIIVRKICTHLEAAVIQYALPGEAAAGVYNLKQLRNKMEGNPPPTPEALERWNRAKKHLKIDQDFINTIKFLVKGGNEAAHDINPEDLQKAKSALSCYPAPHRKNIANVLNSYEQLHLL